MVTKRMLVGPGSGCSGNRLDAPSGVMRVSRLSSERSTIIFERLGVSALPVGYRRHGVCETGMRSPGTTRRSSPQMPRGSISTIAIETQPSTMKCQTPQF